MNIPETLDTGCLKDIIKIGCGQRCIHCVVNKFFLAQKYKFNGPTICDCKQSAIKCFEQDGENLSSKIIAGLILKAFKYHKIIKAWESL